MTQRDAQLDAVLAVGGQVADMIRDHDWSVTSIGPPDTWPDALRTSLAICLHSNFPSALYWGPDFITLYNDAWAANEAGRHPWALGRPGRESRSNFWHVIGPQFESAVATGRGYSTSDQMLPMERGGQMQETWWTYSLVPIRGVDGKVSGLLTQGFETTSQTEARRALAEQSERLRVSDERLRMATEAAVIGIWDYSAASGELRWDDQCRALFGVARDTPISYENAFLGMIHPDDVARVGAAVQQATSPDIRAPYNIDYRIILPGDAGERWIAARGHALFENGQLSRFVGTVIDISERKATEMALRAVAARRSFMSDLADRLRGAHSPDEVIAVATERVARFLRVGGCGYGETDETGEFLDIGGDWTDSETPSLAGRQRLENFGPDLIADLCAGQTVRVDDPQADIRTASSADSFESAGRIRSAVAAPLIKNGRLVAILYVHQTTPRHWTADDDALIGEVAERMWGAVERVKADLALRAETERLAVLNRTGAALAAELDTGRIVQSIVDAGASLIGAEFGAFFYNSQDGAEEGFPLYALSGAPRSAFETFPLPRNTAVFKLTFKGEAVIRSDDILADPRYGLSAPYHGMPRGHLPVRSYLAVPVVSRSGDVIGGLLFGHGEAGRFSPSHETLLLGVAGQAATAIDNARLFAEIAAARERLSRSNDELEREVNERTAKLMQAEEQLRQALKMEAIGQLTGGIAHDFNNMLAVVMGGLTLMRRRLAKGDTDIDKYIDGAMEGAKRAASLTERLLAFSRQQPLAPEPMDPNRMVQGMTEMLTRTLGEAIRVEAVLSAGLWRTYADANQLENVILNLAVNARDAMPDGGRLTIETGNIHVDEDYSRENALAVGQYVMIAVTDTGVGMTQEVIARAFDPFFTTKSVGKGTGLGLSQVFGFIRQSGGHVKIYSEVGVGTTVKVYLPRHYGQTPLPEKRVSSSAKGGHVSEVVLVVEDEERVRAFSIDSLRELGYSVIEAKSGADALRILGAYEVSLLFTDVVMPDMNGRELADLARKAKPGLKVLYTTGYTRNAVVHNGVLDSGTNFLPKPFGIDQLAVKVRQALDVE